MVLAIDIGNTTIAFTGLEEIFRDCGDQSAYADFEIVFSEKIPTQTGKDLDVFLREAGRILSRHGIDAAAGKEPLSTGSREEFPGETRTRKTTVTAVAVSSVVPQCTPAAETLAGIICGREPVVISWRCDTGLSFEKLPFPDKVGADRIADAAWAASRYPLPAMTVDMGTATTINIVSADRRFLGGMIGAGVRTALHSLRTGTAQLPELMPDSVPPEKLIGTDTSGCMLSAAVVGTASMIDGLAAHVEEQIGSPLTLILTGGNAPAVSEWIRHSFVYEPGLAAKGSALIALRDQKRNQGPDAGPTA